MFEIIPIAELIQDAFNASLYEVKNTCQEFCTCGYNYDQDY